MASDAELVVARPEDHAPLAARLVVAALADAVALRGAARWVLAGGGTPAALYRRLAEAHGADLDWKAVEFYWGDERCVPPEDARSNFGGARSQLLGPLGIERRRVHRIPGELGLEAVTAYDAVVGPVLASGPWDLVLLGLGADGHTASLFPGAGEAAVETDWVTAAAAPVEPRLRVSLTLRALSRSRRVVFLVGGAAKEGAVRRVLAGDPASPATHVRPETGRVTWCLDAAAAGEAGATGGAG